MKILPAQLYDSKSNAEVKVFKLLTKSSSLGEDAIAFHSLNIPHHTNQRFGEADFVILSKYGLLVLEVKGGRVKRDEKGWHFINKDNIDTVKRRGPFEQAEEAMHSIYNNLKQHFDYALCKKITIGYGVITPDCDLPSSSEWDDKTILNSINFRLLDIWLKQLMRYWKDKVSYIKNNILEASDIKKIQNYLRPKFECALGLKAQLDNIENQIYSFTKDQFKFIDIIEVNDRVLCSGGAGTGKTFMAAELCRRFSFDNKILLVCKSRILERYLHDFLQLENVIVSTIESIKVKSKRNNIEEYDVVIIDEGQDICNFDDIDKLGGYIKNGWENGKWTFFHDINNQANIIGKFDNDAMEYLKSCSPVTIPLKKNCRNTEPIMNSIQLQTQFDMGNSGTGIGPKVDILSSNNAPEIVLSEQLQNLHSKSINYDDIVILSTKDFNNSCISKLNRGARSKIEIIDERNISNPSINKIKFSRIGDFKGLERKCIILVDMDEKSENYKSLLYVGMSRAIAKLIIIL